MPPPVPLVALPDWYGQDVEAHLIQVDSALHTNGSAEILSQPERFFHLLLSTCKYQRKAIEFLQAWRATHPITDVSSVKSAFLERFQSEVRNRQQRPGMQFRMSSEHVCTGLCKFV